MTSIGETYTVLALSIAHLEQQDTIVLTQLSEEGSTMIFERATGYFIKFYEPLKLNLRCRFSSNLRNIISMAHLAGFRMIEIDCDAQTIDSLPQHEW